MTTIITMLTGLGLLFIEIYKLIKEYQAGGEKAKQSTFLPFYLLKSKKTLQHIKRYFFVVPPTPKGAACFPFGFQHFTLFFIRA